MSDDPRLRALPSVRLVLDRIDPTAFAAVGRNEALRAIRAGLDRARATIRSGGSPNIDPAALARVAVEEATADVSRLRPVINATGILLNTGLGRAPLAAEAIEEVVRVAAGYCSLEVDLASGGRGDRSASVERLLLRLTGAEAATVVNNNAAATVLALRALAIGREVIVSRGQLVEIGGSYRLPEVFEASGARLREVGTTNKTRLSDYARAIGPETAAILRVHASNYRIVGFAESVSIADLARLAREAGIACIDDVGSGRLRPDLPPGLGDEPSVSEGVDAGADLVLFSGDKLLGGPQSGLMVGRRDAVNRVEADPLARAFRVDKLTLAALAATLRLALASTPGHPGIPLWQRLAVPIDTLQSRAESVSSRLVPLGYRSVVEPTEAMLGGGSDPARPIPSRAVRLAPPYPVAGWGEGDLARALRLGDPTVVPRVQGGAVLIDLKAVAPEEDAAIVSALASIARSG